MCDVIEASPRQGRWPLLWRAARAVGRHGRFHHHALPAEIAPCDVGRSLGITVARTTATLMTAAASSNALRTLAGLMALATAVLALAGCRSEEHTSELQSRE